MHKGLEGFEFTGHKFGDLQIRRDGIKRILFDALNNEVTHRYDMPEHDCHHKKVLDKGNYQILNYNPKSNKHLPANIVEKKIEEKKYIEEDPKPRP